MSYYLYRLPLWLPGSRGRLFLRLTYLLCRFEFEC